MNTLINTKTSFSKKDITAILNSLNIYEPEVKQALSNITKTMVGKKEVLSLVTHTCISFYGDDTGLDFTVDQLLVDVEKHLGKTFTYVVLNSALKEIWGSVAPTLHQYPKGHALMKIVIIELSKKFDGKQVVGIAQVREALNEIAIEAYLSVFVK